MTEEELRKIDALVAEHVMDWPAVEQKGTEWGWTVPALASDPYLRMKSEGKDLFWDHLPEFSSEIHDAWRVVDKLRKEGKGMDIWTYAWETLGSKPKQYVCQFTRPMSEFPRAVADTAPLAICLAALKTKGITP